MCFNLVSDSSKIVFEKVFTDIYWTEEEEHPLKGIYEPLMETINNPVLSSHPIAEAKNWVCCIQLGREASLRKGDLSLIA